MRFKALLALLIFVFSFIAAGDCGVKDAKRWIIKNRKNQQIVALVNQTYNQRGLAFVMHGLGGEKTQTHIQAAAQAFVNNGYTVVRFDATNSIGESDGNYENATTTNYYEDLEDVINRAKNEAWYEEPFALAGYSLGGICAGFYAENYPEKVKELVLVSTVVSGKLSIEAYQQYAPEILAEWDRTGWRDESSYLYPNKRLNWFQHKADRLKYDLLPDANKLTMPILLVVGEKDITTPPEHQKILYDALPGEKKFVIIKGASHTSISLRHLLKLRRVLDEWAAGLR